MVLCLPTADCQLPTINCYPLSTTNLRAAAHIEYVAPMTEHAIGSLIGFVLILLSAAHLLGNLFSRLRQPRVIGEILAGVLIGPSLLSIAMPAQQLGGKAALDLLYWIGLLLL